MALYGGEPTSRGDLLKIIDVAKKNNYRRIKLLTNGRALSNMQFVEQLINAGCHLFEIKLWASNPSLHDRITQSANSFQETINGLENLSGYPGEKFVCTRIPACKENISDMENTVVTALNFGINRIIISVQDHQLSFQSLLPRLKNAINISIFNRTWILIEGLPFCAMQGLEQHMAEIYNGWNTIYDKVFQQHDYCPDCAYKELCPGVEAGYVDRFGIREFIPVSADKYVPGIRALYE